MENEHKNFADILFFSEIMLVDRGIYDHDLRKEMKIVFNFSFCCCHSF